MLRTWWRKRRRKRLWARPLPSGWWAWFERLPFWSALGSMERDRLVRVARVLIREKDWEGCGGLQLTDEMRVTIAGQAALLVLARPESEWFPRVPSILVYPGAYVSPLPRAEADGTVSVGTANHGEAWQRGPVVLNWDEVARGVSNDRDGRNLVLHEFAHKLDMLDGFADGRPPIDASVEQRRWHDVMLAEFEALQEAASTGRPSFLDAYGATNPAEFFAVATEAFFEKASSMAREHPELYGVLRGYYRQDPARR